MIDNATDLELTVLEDLLNDECKCEYKHRKTVCSHNVTHRVLACVESPLVCFNAASFIVTFWNNTTCNKCGKVASECWSIRPV